MNGDKGGALWSNAALKLRILNSIRDANTDEADEDATTGDGRGGVLSL